MVTGLVVNKTKPIFTGLWWTDWPNFKQDVRYWHMIWHYTGQQQLVDMSRTLVRLWTQKEKIVLLSCPHQWAPRGDFSECNGMLLWLGQFLPKSSQQISHSLLVRASYGVSFEDLTHCGLVTPYDNRDLGQHWFRQWLVAWRHQAITWTNVDWSSVTYSDIHLRAISQEIPQPWIPKISLKINYLKFH